MVRINPHRVLLFLLVADTALLGMFLLGEAGHIPIWTIQRLTLMNGESDLPTWLSSTQLLIAGLLLLMRAAALRHSGATHGLLLGFGGAAFVLLSIDEATVLHESVTLTMRGKNVPPWTWFAKEHQAETVTLGLYAAAGLMLLAWRRRDVPALLRETYVWWIAAGLAIMVVGGVVVDSVWPRDTWWRAGGEAIEDYLELVGGSILVYGALRAVHGVRLHITPAPGISEPPHVAAENSAHREIGAPARNAHGPTTASARGGSE